MFSQSSVFSVSKVAHRRLHRKKTKWMYCRCCSIGLQWPNPPQQWVSLIHTLSAGKDGKTCQLPEHDILPVIPLFFFSGVTLAHRAVMTCLFHCAENTEGREGGVYWSLLAAKRLYDYCSLSDWSVQWKNNRGDNPQRSPSGLTDWKLLDCLIIKYVFSLEALE